MTDSLDDTRFWDEPGWTTTGPVEQTRARARGGSFERTRSHRDVRRDDGPPAEAMTFDDFAPHDDDPWGQVDHWVEPLEHVRSRAFAVIDPKLLRIGAVAMAGVLMIPLAIALRDDSSDGVRSETLADVASTVAPSVVADPVTTVVTVPITAAATVPVTAATPRAAPSAAAPQALAAVEPEERECAGTYTVIANDFWNRFPKTSGAAVQEWLQANNATVDTPLYVGDELCIPPGAQAPAPPPPPTTQAPATTQPATTQPPATQAPTTTPPPDTSAAPAVPAPPAAAAPAATVARVMPADPATVEAIIREVWPDEIEERALAIARRESGLRPEAHNWCCYGIFAIYFDMGRNWLPGLGITSPDQLFDARTNIRAAYHLYTLAGWEPWAQTDPG